MLQVLLTVLVALHLLLVDVAMVGPLVCVWLEWRDTRYAERAAGRLGKTWAGLVHWTLAGGIVLGCLLLAIRWWMDDRAYFSAVAVIPVGRLWFGLGELLFSFGCMGAYVALWNRWRNHRLMHRALAIAAAANLLMHFPALFTIISVLTTRVDQWGQVLDRAGYQRLLLDTEVVPRVIHVWLAAFAANGVLLMVFGLRLGDDEAQPALRRRLIQRGAWLGLAPTLLQIPAGLWLVLQMPDAARQPLLGGDWLSSGLFLGSLFLALQLIHTLSAIALGDPEPKLIRRSVAILLALVLLMVGTRACLHEHALGPLGSSDGRPAALHRTEIAFQ